MGGELNLVLVGLVLGLLASMLLLGRPQIVIPPGERYGSVESGGGCGLALVLVVLLLGVLALASRAQLP